MKIEIEVPETVDAFMADEGCAERVFQAARAKAREHGEVVVGLMSAALNSYLAGLFYEVGGAESIDFHARNSARMLRLLARAEAAAEREGVGHA